MLRLYTQNYSYKARLWLVIILKIIIIIAALCFVGSLDVAVVASSLDNRSHRCRVLPIGLFSPRLGSEMGANCHLVLLPRFLLSIMGLPRRRSLLRNPSLLKGFGVSLIHTGCIQADGRVGGHGYWTGSCLSKAGTRVLV